MRPESDAANLDGGEKGRGVFGIARGDSAPALEMKEGILDQMAQFVEVAVNFSLDLAIFLGRYLRLHALLSRLRQDGVGVVTAIGQQMLGGEAFDQF